ncbi:MAG: type IV toxin-antitoxin system AbiEi family antitoxin domain-containing protein [Nitrospirota bacterium]
MKCVDLERRAEAAFLRHRGVLRTSHALKLGIHPRILSCLRDAGRLVSVPRGVYRLAELPEPSRPDLLVVARRVPRAMICLISALSFHGLTTQIPHDVWLRGSEFGPQFRADN